MVCRNTGHIYLLIFSLELEIFGWLYRTHQTSKQQKTEELLSENGSETFLVNFCCYEFCANVSEAVQKFNTRTLNFHTNSL